MEIISIPPFIEYMDKIHERTMRVAAAIPSDRLEFRYAEGKFSPGDLVRHIAATKRFVFVECATGGHNRYPGCGVDLAAGLDCVMDFAKRLHRESVSMLRTMQDARLHAKCESADGTPITVWKLLRAMVEHEVHHRGELYALVGMLESRVPPLYGLSSEQLRLLSTRAE